MELLRGNKDKADNFSLIIFTHTNTHAHVHTRTCAHAHNPNHVEILPFFHKVNWTWASQVSLLFSLSVFFTSQERPWNTSSTSCRASLCHRCSAINLWSGYESHPPALSVMHQLKQFSTILVKSLYKKGSNAGWFLRALKRPAPSRHIYY